MTEKQLDQDAADYCRVNLYDNEPFRQDVLEAFRDGMEHTMELPLAERLTEEEQSNLKELHSTVVKTYLGGSHISFDGWFHIMKQIFGDNILDDLYTDKSK